MPQPPESRPTPDPKDPDTEAMHRAFGEEGGKVEVWRKAPDALEFKRLPGRPTKGFDPDTMALTYGGGHYRFIVRNSKGQFSGQYETEYDAAVSPRAAEPVADDAGGGPKGSMELMMFVFQQQAENQRAMAAMQLENMKAIAAAISTRPAGPGVAEIFSMVKDTLALSGAGGGKSVSPVASAREVLGLIGDMQERLGGGDDGGETTADVKLIGVVGGLLKSIIEQRANQQPAAPAAAPAPAPAAAIPVKAEAPAPKPAVPAPDPFVERYPNLWPLLSVNIKELEGAVAQGISAAQTALGIVKSTPVALEEELLGFSGDREAVAAITAAHGPLKQHTPWLRELLSCINKALASKRAGQGA